MQEEYYKKPWYKKIWIFYLALVVVLIIAVIFIARWQFGEYRAGLLSGEMTPEELLQKFFVEDDVSSVLVDEYFLDPTSKEVKALIGTAPYFGSQDAKAVIVSFEDFHCPYCQNTYPEIKKLLGYYGDQILFVFRQFPVLGDQKAAEASLCANDQGLFWLYHDHLFTYPDDLSVGALKDVAIAIGLDNQLFDVCLDSEKYTKKVQADILVGAAYGAAATPTFFINGFMISGEVKFEQFQQVIDFLLENVE